MGQPTAQRRSSPAPCGPLSHQPELMGRERLEEEALGVPVSFRGLGGGGDSSRQEQGDAAVSAVALFENTPGVVALSKEEMMTVPGDTVSA